VFEKEAEQIEEGARSVIKSNEERFVLNDINVKADGGKKTCNIIDCCHLSEQHLVLCDKSNCSLKFIDVKCNQLVYKRSVGLAPKSVTKVDDHQIACAQPYDLLELVRLVF
jgi:hypothetical protein